MQTKRGRPKKVIGQEVEDKDFLLYNNDEDEKEVMVELGCVGNAYEYLNDDWSSYDKVRY